MCDGFAPGAVEVVAQAVTKLGGSKLLCPNSACSHALRVLFPPPPSHPVVSDWCFFFPCAVVIAGHVGNRNTCSRRECSFGLLGRLASAMYTTIWCTWRLESHLLQLPAGSMGVVGHRQMVLTQSLLLSLDDRTTLSPWYSLYVFTLLQLFFLLFPIVFAFSDWHQFYHEKTFPFLVAWFEVQESNNKTQMNVLSVFTSHC